MSWYFAHMIKGSRNNVWQTLEVIEKNMDQPNGKDMPQKRKLIISKNYGFFIRKCNLGIEWKKGNLAYLSAYGKYWKKKYNLE